MMHAFQRLPTGAHTWNVPYKWQISLFFALSYYQPSKGESSGLRLAFYLLAVSTLGALGSCPLSSQDICLCWSDNVAKLTYHVLGYDLFFSGLRFLIFKSEDFRKANGFKLCASYDRLVMSVWNHEWRSHHIQAYQEEVS